MKIVGLNHGEYNSSAALVVDGEVVAAAAEERFVRQKKTKNFPGNSLKFCLSEQETDCSNIDAFQAHLANLQSTLLLLQKETKNKHLLHGIDGV